MCLISKCVYQLLSTCTVHETIIACSKHAMTLVIHAYKIRVPQLISFFSQNFCFKKFQYLQFDCSIRVSRSLQNFMQQKFSYEFCIWNTKIKQIMVVTHVMII